MPEAWPQATVATRRSRLLQRLSRGAMPLMLASLAAQALAFLISPVLTRLFLPADMGQFALYSSALSILVLLATARYDMAIITPRHDSAARALVWLVGRIGAAFLGLFLAVLSIYALARGAGWHAFPLAAWVWIVPFGVAASAALLAGNAYLTRHQRFQTLAWVRISGAVVSSGLSVLLGYWHFGAMGLIAAAMTGLLFSAWMALGAAGLQHWPRAGARRLLAQARRYRNYPRIDLPSALLGVVASQLPTMLIGICFGAPALGLYALVDRILAAPLVTLGAPLAASFRVQATSLANQGLGYRGPYVRTLALLVTLSGLIYLPVFFAGEALFSTVFGAGWGAAGRMAEILAPLYFVRLVTSPLSMSLYVRDRMQVDLVGQIALCLLYLAAIYLGWRAGDVYLALGLIATFNSVVYLAYIIYGYSIARQ